MPSACGVRAMCTHSSKPPFGGGSARSEDDGEVCISRPTSQRSSGCRSSVMGALHSRLPSGPAPGGMSSTGSSLSRTCCLRHMSRVSICIARRKQSRPRASGRQSASCSLAGASAALRGWACCSSIPHREAIHWSGRCLGLSPSVRQSRWMALLRSHGRGSCSATQSRATRFSRPGCRSLKAEKWSSMACRAASQLA